MRRLEEVEAKLERSFLVGVPERSERSVRSGASPALALVAAGQRSADLDSEEVTSPSRAQTSPAEERAAREHFYRDLDSRFEAEPADAAWTRTETLLTGTLSQFDAEFMTLTSVDCRSTSCRSVLHYSDRAAPEVIDTLISRTAAGELDHTIRYEEHATFIYSRRPGVPSEGDSEHGEP